MTTTPCVGDPAPDFTLPSTSGDAVTLSALRGRAVLLAFFPLAFSETCTAELCDVRDDWSQFAERGVVVHPISVDSTYTLKEYKAKYALPVDLLSDFMREVTHLYGVYLPKKNYANRAYFLVDSDGILRWAHAEEHPGKRRTNAELLARIDEAIPR